LEVDEDTAKNRGGFGEERYEKLEFQKKVKNIYNQLQSEDNQV